MAEHQRKPNGLINEKSPYLLKHAYNPVAWRAWNPETLAKAKNDGKPIFLSVGYSTCHWCTVMERESFEDEKVAALLNKSFIPVKVDREERPDIDSYYMNALQTMTGQGGWPMNIFLTPDLKPFYGGTYFPPDQRYGTPSFTQVLEFVADLWKNKRDEVTANAAQIQSALQQELEAKAKPGLSAELLDSGYAALMSAFDPERGGFGRAPKFPLPSYVAFLLRYQFRTGKEMAGKGALKTLDEMAAGGIRDHVGGGFHRYSTDRSWLVPHFEKMLYDNALLAKAYVEAYQATGEQKYAETARETLGWLLREMRSKEGGFFSAQDADTTEGEGTYYTWTPAEVKGVLGEEEGAEFCRAYGVTSVGNFEGRNILNAVTPVEAEKRRRWTAALYEARLKRPRPATDDKVLVSWNGLAVSAFAFAGRALADEGYTKAAAAAASFILEGMTRDGRLLRRYRDGDVAIEGTLEDYAFLARGLLDLFEATNEADWLRGAVRLAEEMNASFWDEAGGGFFNTEAGSEFRMKESYDGPTPSGNSVACEVLILLSELTGREEWRERARRTLETFHTEIEERPTGHTEMLTALDLLLNGVREIVVTSPSAGEAKPMLDELSHRFLPDAVSVAADAKSFGALSKVTPLLEGREPKGGAVAYVCQNRACRLPAETVEGLRSELEASWRAGPAAGQEG